MTEMIVEGFGDVARNPRRTADEYAVWLIDLMALEGLDREVVTDAIVSSVVPEGNFNLTTLCKRYFKCDPMFIGEDDCDLGIEALIDRPDQVGADLVCGNTVAVHGDVDMNRGGVICPP